MVASYNGHYECVRELIMQGADINYQREVWWEKNRSFYRSRLLWIISAPWAHRAFGTKRIFARAHTQHIWILILSFQAAPVCFRQPYPSFTTCSHGFRSRVIRLNRWVVKTTHQTTAIDIFKDYSKISPCGCICFCTQTNRKYSFWSKDSSVYFYRPFQTGSTALFFASQQGHNEVVKLLFEFGASTECRTKVEWSAELSQNTDTTRLILLFWEKTATRSATLLESCDEPFFFFFVWRVYGRMVARRSPPPPSTAMLRWWTRFWRTEPMFTISWT